MNNLMVERFNVAGAMVCKIFGRPEQEAAELFPTRPLECGKSV